MPALSVSLLSQPGVAQAGGSHSPPGCNGDPPASSRRAPAAPLLPAVGCGSSPPATGEIRAKRGRGHG